MDTDRDDDVAPAVHRADGDDDQPLSYPESAIAIVGVACRFAGANSVEDLWRIFETGATQCAELPEHRFPASRSAQRPFKPKLWASLMSDIDAFDHKFFNVPSREASFRDPQQRLALEVIYQALESAGYFAREITDEQRDVGCYIATAMNEYRENVVTHPPSAFSLTGSVRPFIAGQVSHHFGFTGPAIMIDAACAASGAAVNIACRAVASGECKSAIVGGTNVFITADTFQDLAAGHFTSPTGPSKPFDVAADGYCRGEGVAAIVIKKLSDALRDGDIVKGVISATATNQCANTVPITVPHGPTQSDLYRKALKLAHLTADQVGYVEAHGTGTRVGDPIEAASIRAVFGNLDHGCKTYLGSLKSTIGHTEASAGLSGLIKVMLMIEKGVIPRQALFNSLNPEIPPLKPYGLIIPTKNVSWSSRYRAGCVNNYGASGSNSVVILTQPPTPITKVPASRPDAYPVSITAFSEKSLKTYCSALLAFIDKLGADENEGLDISFHLSRMRNPDLTFSVATTVTNLSELKDLLASTLAGTTKSFASTKRPTVLFFAGQDGKPVTVSKALYDFCAIFRKHLDDCDAALQALNCPRLYPTIFASDRSDSSILAHSKLFSVQYASAKAWIDSGLRPSRLVGHSFGQLTALCVSGALSLEDGLHLITSRARLIDERWGADTGSMIAIESTHEGLCKLMKQNSDVSLEKACYNGPKSFVLAGPTSSIDSMEHFLTSLSESPRFKRLQVPHAFHSPLADPLIEPLQEVVKNLRWQEPNIPLETCSERDCRQSIDPSLVASHIRDPVFFHQAVQRIASHLGPSVWIEAGTGGNASFLRRALEPQISHEVKSIKIDSPSSLRHLAELTADLWKLNLKVQFWPFHPIQQHQYQILNLPPYQFDKIRHWLEWQEIGVPNVSENPLSLEPKPLIRLVRQTHDGGEFEVDTQSERWQTTCSDNRILGLAVCPMSLVLDLVSEAIGSVQSTLGQKAGMHRVQHMNMPSPIPAEMHSRIRVKIGKTDHQQSWTFRFSTAADSKDEFASGLVYPGEAKTQPDFTRFERLVDNARIELLKNDPNTEFVRGKGVYKISANLFQFPKSSRVIREVIMTGNEAAAMLTSLPKNSSGSTESLLQIPLICLNGIHHCPDDHIFANTTVADVQFRATPALMTDIENSSHSVYLKFFGLEEQQPTCDMYVFETTSGKISATMLDIGFTLISVKSLRKDLDSNCAAFPEQTANLQVDVPEIPVASGSSVLSSRASEPDTFDNDSIHQESDSLPDLAQALRDLLVRVADVNAEKIHDATVMADLGIDSLMWMEIADEINKFFAVNIDSAKLLVVEDMRALYQLVANHTSEFSYRASDVTGSPSSANTESDTIISSFSTETSKDGEKQNAKRPLPVSGKSVSTVSDVAFQSFDNIRRDFDVYAKETGCDAYWSEIHPVQTSLIETYVLEAFVALGCDLTTFEAGENISIVPLKPGRDKLLKRLMLVLRDAGIVSQSENDRWTRTAKPITVSSPSIDLFNKVQSRFPQWAPEHELLHLAGSHLAGHLDGSQNSVQLFFGSAAKRALMADQYRLAPIQSAISRLLASWIRQTFSISQTTFNSHNQRLKVLEIGGGTCGTTVYALDALLEAGISFEYTFTDLSPSFLAAARTKLKKYGDDVVRFRTLDVTQAPPARELQGAFDLVLATNVLHATPDAAASAANAKRMLRPGGVLALVEYTRAYAGLDVIFGQLDGWWLFADGRTHAIMDVRAWEETLHRAGYGRVAWTGSETAESEILRIILAA